MTRANEFLTSFFAVETDTTRYAIATTLTQNRHSVAFFQFLMGIIMWPPCLTLYASRIKKIMSPADTLNVNVINMTFFTGLASRMC